jgi:predicted amidohydrolase YtcJ
MCAVSLFGQVSADLVLVGGKIRTLNPSQPVAEAVACRAGRIIGVGSDAQVRMLAGPSTRIIELHGRLALPGFNDAHVHLLSGGQNLTSVQLRDARSETEFRERIRAYASKLPKGRWITGGNWDHENWTPVRLPTRRLIDDVTPDNPVFVKRLDGHSALANSLALKLAGITRDTPDPPGGAIVRDRGGEPTGILKDGAMAAVNNVVTPPTAEEMAEALRAAMRHAAEHGVTSVQDMSASPQVFAVYEKLLAAGELTVRIYGHQPLPQWERLAAVGLRAAFGNEKLKIGALKGFADGSLGSTTALLFEPYLDAPNTSGLPSDEMIPESAMLERILGADQAGLQVAIHAIGDKANHLILNLYEQAERRNGARDRRFRIEHAQHLRADDIPRFGKLHVIASMQPLHLVDDGRWAEKRIGPERAKGAYAFRSLLDSGAVLAFGSDWDVAALDPVMSIWAAATRQTADGKHPGGWIPEQKITVEEAVRAHTLGSAYASFDEDIKGSIEPGKLADIVVLSDDIFTMHPEDIRKAKVEITVFDGRVIYESR